MQTEGRVLVVDDEPAIRALVAKIVERAGHPVDTAADGAEAILRLDEREYAVIVLDLMMPNLDGYGLVEYLRSKPRRPAIIVVSAGESASIRKLDGTVVHSVLRKPFDIDVLGDLITAAAQSKRNEAEQGEIIPFPQREGVC